MTQSADFSPGTGSTQVVNKRKYARLPVQTHAAIQVRGARQRQSMGMLENVSANGLGILTERPPRLGEQVTVHVLIHGNIHPILAQVVHISRGTGRTYVVGLHAGLLVLQDQGFMARALGLDGRVG